MTGGKALTDELPFRVVRSNSYDETLVRCTNLPIAQAALPCGFRGKAEMDSDGTRTMFR